MTVVWGTQYIETARQLLYARLVELVSDMSTGYDPTFAEAHDHHLVAGLVPNAITIGLDSAATVPGSMGVGSGDNYAKHALVFGIRVHTDYVGGWQDEMKQARLLESIENKLRARIYLATADQPRSEITIESVGPIQTTQSFEETSTIGGSIMVAVTITVGHTQE